MAFNMSKCMATYMGRYNIHCKYWMNVLELEPINKEKDVGLIISSDLMRSGQCMHAYSSRSVVQLVAGISKFCSVFIRHWSYLTSSIAHQTTRKTNTFWKVSNIALHEWFQDIKVLTHANILKKLGLWTIEERRNRADLLEVFKMKAGVSATPLTY